MIMLINLTSSVCFFIVLIILIIDFFSKETLKNLDNESFKSMTIVCIAGLFLEFINYFLVYRGFDKESELMLILGKTLFI